MLDAAPTLLLCLLAVPPGAPPAPPALTRSVDAAPARVAPAPLDPAPVFATGAGARARAALEEGRHAEAAQAFARLPGPEAAFLRALALEALGRDAEVVRALAGLEAKLPDLADRIALHRGRALERAGKRREALAAWGEVTDGSLVSIEARLARGRLAGALGDRAAALDALAPLLERAAPEEEGVPDVPAEALLLAGRLLLQGPTPDPEGARRVWLQCWADHPLAPEASACLSALGALPAPHAAPPGPAESLRRAEALLAKNRSAAALSLLEKLLPGVAVPAPGEDFACRARAALGRAHRRERSHSAAVDALRPVVEGCDDPAVRVRALYVLAGAAAAAGQRPEAIVLYRRLAREFPRHTLADDALYHASELLAREGREAEAHEALAAVARGDPGGDYRDEARFRLAWLARRAGRLDAAAAQLLAIEESERHEDPYEHARAAYWRARILAGQGEAGAAAAKVVWADLASRYPADYYGLLSRDRLGVAIPAALDASKVTAPAWDPGPLAADRHFRAGVALLRLGLHRDAAEELSAIDPAKLAGSGDAPEPVLAVADLLDRAGDHRAASFLLRTRARFALRRAPEGESLRAWRIAYPPAFRPEVEKWAPPAGVPPALLLALMREESALDPRAVSPAGAIGLTQLMLPTARDMARQLKLPRPSKTDLKRVPLNIRFGARYLGQLIRRFDGSAPLALAAYNAGGGNVNRWLGERGDLEVDEFVEEIPFEETRGYVKRVLRSYSAYRLLYGEPEGVDAQPLRIIRTSAEGPG
jgi:soluble lytic murein transglycosylase